MTERCEVCARILHTGEARIVMAFTINELASLAEDTQSFSLQNRLLKAIGLLDPELARKFREP